MRKLTYPLILLVSSPLSAADYPEPTQADHVLRDFRFASGDVLPELRIHFRTLGSVQKDEHGSPTKNPAVVG
jgi:homoserine O-acetyltransferase